jgi:hypothetical protein
MKSGERGGDTTVHTVMPCGEGGRPSGMSNEGVAKDSVRSRRRNREREAGTRQYIQSCHVEKGEGHRECRMRE